MRHLAPLSNCCFEIFDKGNIKPATPIHAQLQCTAITYCSAYHPPTLWNSHEKTNVLLSETNFKILETLVAST